MKSVLYFSIILILFQTLFFGSLVKIDTQNITHQRWKESGIRNQSVLDPYLIPAKDGIAQNLQIRNEWNTFHTNSFALRNNTILPVISGSRYKSGLTPRYKTTPAYIIHNNLRI